MTLTGSCSVMENALVGIHASVLNGAVVGDDCIVYEIGAGGVQRVSTHGIEERIRTQVRRLQGLRP